jgi:hypothetical protein
MMLTCWFVRRITMWAGGIHRRSQPGECIYRLKKITRKFIGTYIYEAAYRHHTSVASASCYRSTRDTASLFTIHRPVQVRLIATPYKLSRQGRIQEFKCGCSKLHLTQNLVEKDENNPCLYANKSTYRPL